MTEDSVADIRRIERERFRDAIVGIAVKHCTAPGICRPANPVCIPCRARTVLQGGK